MHGLYKLFIGDARPNSENDEWIFEDVDSIKDFIIPAARTALKVHQVSVVIGCSSPLTSRRKRSNKVIILCTTMLLNCMLSSHNDPDNSFCVNFKLLTHRTTLHSLRSMTLPLVCTRP